MCRGAPASVVRLENCSSRRTKVLAYPVCGDKRSLACRHVWKIKTVALHRKKVPNSRTQALVAMGDFLLAAEVGLAVQPPKTALVRNISQPAHPLVTARTMVL